MVTQQIPLWNRMPVRIFPCKVLNSPWLALPADPWHPCVNGVIFFSVITARYILAITHSRSRKFFRTSLVQFFLHSCKKITTLPGCGATLRRFKHRHRITGKSSLKKNRTPVLTKKQALVLIRYRRPVETPRRPACCFIQPKDAPCRSVLPTQRRSFRFLTAFPARGDCWPFCCIAVLRSTFCWSMPWWG